MQKIPVNISNIICRNYWIEVSRPTLYKYLKVKIAEE